MTFVDKVKNFTSTMVETLGHLLNSGVGNVSKEVQEDRLALCMECHFLVESIDKVRLCAECGCFLRGKTKLKASKCPLGKW